MPRPRIPMRKIREVLRLTFGERLSRRQVSLATGIPFTTVGDHVRRAVLAGLSRQPRAIPSRFLYDARGSGLFDRICELPEYYVTRTETAPPCSISLGVTSAESANLPTSPAMSVSVSDPVMRASRHAMPWSPSKVNVPVANNAPLRT